MNRLVITDQDLSKQTIEGQPFSYIGRCRGTDIKMVGDWTHVSHFGNDFLRPDWSKAKTRWSYSRFNKFTDAKTSFDMNPNDHDMLLAAIEESMAKLTGVSEDAMALAGRMLRENIAKGSPADTLEECIAKGAYLISHGNVAPHFVGAFGGDMVTAMEAVNIYAAGREQLISRVMRGSQLEPDRLFWEGTEEPNPVIGIAVSGWGVVARARDGREYRRHWSELPIPHNNHDRVEMAELIEAEVEKATGLDVTLGIVDILPWRTRATRGHKPRDWWVE